MRKPASALGTLAFFLCMPALLLGGNLSRIAALGWGLSLWQYQGRE